MTASSFDRPSRRAVIGGALACSIAPSGAYAAASGAIMAGTYAGEGGKGLVPLSPGAAGWTAGSPQAAIANASFGVMGSRHRLRYLLDEQDRGRVGVYDGSLRRLADRSTLGSGPCHAALDPAQTSLAVANYGSGDIALWRLDPATGLPQGEAQRVAHDGHGPDAGRQAGPHAHWVGFTSDGRILHAVDLGADAIFAHHIDAKDGRIGATHIAYRAVAGSGPRHLARHPRLPIAYLVAELNNMVTVLRARADGTFTAQGVVSTLPAGWSGASAAAHIALNRAGTRLYVSNRGHDSIAVFAVAADGALTLLQHVGCGGHWPRLFLLLEDRGEMLVANERSGSIASLRIASDGRLSATGRTVGVPGVAFLAT